MEPPRIKLEIWLYGSLARYAPDGGQPGYAQIQLEVPRGTCMADLLSQFGLPRDEKGITFINGQLTDMPGMGADLDWQFSQGDRVGIFHRQSMWPFQYRFGASTSNALKEASRGREGGALYHSPVTPDPELLAPTKGGEHRPTSAGRVDPSDPGDPDEKAD